MKFDDVFQLEQAAWPALLADTTGAVRRANPAAKNFFGPKLEGDSVSLSSVWPAENGVTPQELIERAEKSSAPAQPLKLRGKGIVLTDFSASVCPVTTGGEKFFLFQLFQSSGTPGGPDGKPPAVEGSVGQKQKLDCALQLTRTVALDFNNSLTTILGHATYLLGNAPADHPWRASLIEVEKAAERASDIADQLAAFSAEDKESRAQAAGNLNHLLRRTIELFQTPQNSGLAWSLHLEKQIFSAIFDEAKIQQAFVKVLENAAQAVKADGRITVQTRNMELSAATQDRTAHLMPGAYVCVEISDDGCGIEPAVLPRIFEPFFTTKYGHRGLGLAWVYGIITNHGGGVAVSSQLAHGTSVRIYFPALNKTTVDTSFLRKEDPTSKTILLVDDEEMILNMSQMVLSSHGYKVLTATSGEKGLATIAESKAAIDLLVTDMVMPKMNGRELIHQVRQVSPATRVVCATACSRTLHGEHEMDFLSKPYTSQQLLRKVKECLAE